MQRIAMVTLYPVKLSRIPSFLIWFVVDKNSEKDSNQLFLLFKWIFSNKLILEESKWNRFSWENPINSIKWRGFINAKKINVYFPIFTLYIHPYNYAVICYEMHLLFQHSWFEQFTGEPQNLRKSACSSRNQQTLVCLLLLFMKINAYFANEKPHAINDVEAYGLLI